MNLLSGHTLHVGFADLVVVVLLFRPWVIGVDRVEASLLASSGIWICFVAVPVAETVVDILLSSVSQKELTKIALTWRFRLPLPNA